MQSQRIGGRRRVFGPPSVRRGRRIPRPGQFEFYVFAAPQRIRRGPPKRCNRPGGAQLRAGGGALRPQRYLGGRTQIFRQRLLQAGGQCLPPRHTADPCGYGQPFPLPQRAGGQAAVQRGPLRGIPGGKPAGIQPGHHGRCHERTAGLGHGPGLRHAAAAGGRTKTGPGAHPSPGPAQRQLGMAAGAQAAL